MRGMRIGGGVTALLAGVLLLGCGEGDAAPQAGGASGGGRGPGGMGGGPAAVEVVTVEQGSIARSVTVSGVIEPIRTVGVNSQLSGAVLAVNVEEGDAVSRGAVLARMDDRELRAQLAAAEASLQVTEAAYERAEQLRDRRVITLPEYERERTAYAAAQAQVDQLRTRIGYATVNAPVAGVITEKRVEAGDVVGSQTRLFDLADVSTLVVRVGVSELDVVEVNPGDRVRVALDAFPGREFQGRVRRVFPSADPTTRLVPVEVALEGTGARPGFLARTTFELGERENVLLIPASAVVSGGGTPSVFVLQDGRAYRRTVETGLTSEGRVEVVVGLEPGERIITAGNNMLRDGMEVRVVTGPEARAATEPSGGADSEGRTP